MTPVLQLARVSKFFGGVRALCDVDFKLRRGEVHCLAGENGCGKSTLIKIITGVYTPEPGAEITFNGEPAEALTPGLARQQGIQVIWQDLALFPEMSVAENIAFDMNLTRTPRWVDYSAMRAVAKQTMLRLGFDLDLDLPVRDLTIAQRQIVAICRALVAEAKIVFMDEPTASLTQTEAQALFAVVRKLSDEGITVVFVSHRLTEIMEISERVTVLRDGRSVGVFDTADMTPDRLTELMTGKTINYEVQARDCSTQSLLLEVTGLSRAGEYEDVSFTVQRGEIVGITGLLGAGRTELASSLFGLTQADKGVVRLDGKVVAPRSPQAAIEAGIAYVSEDRLSLGLDQRQSIADNIAVTVLDQLLRWRLLSATLKTLLVSDWIERLSVKVGEPDDAVSTLSGGNQQRVVLGKWLATNPKVLILDSPTVGVDVGARAGIFEIVRALANDGMGIVMISDEIPETYYNADRILHMRDGRLVAAFQPRDVKIGQIEMAVNG
ncbi:MAG: sugar ABC transporter ATP-binding protein [Woeseiaceae bacterium]